MPAIKEVKARQILDSRGNPTVEVSIVTSYSVGTASVPSGASTGVHEAIELRDNKKDFHGKSVQKAIKHINTKIAPLIGGINCLKQHEVDTLMIQADGTKNKKHFGANAILAVSLANAKAAAIVLNKNLYEYLNLHEAIQKDPALPRTFFNIINGGKHADNKLSFQEFMIVPKFSTFSKNLQAASEIYHTLKQELHKKYGKGATNVGDEGGFAPVKLSLATQALDLLKTAIKKSGYNGKVELALDVAASEIYKKSTKKYHIDGKQKSKQQLIEYYLKLCKKYPIASIEDPFDQDDFTAFTQLRQSLKKAKLKVQIVGDDLTVSNPKRLQRAIDEDAIDCILLKVNQIGTLTEAIDTAKLAFDNNLKVMVSHRSGETEDTFIADLAVALGCKQLKAGAPARGERTAKYNQLLRIEEGF